MGRRGPKQQFTDVSCPNPGCSRYRAAGMGNIVGNGTYRAGGEIVRKFLCKECGRTFNSRTGTSYEGLRTDVGKINAAMGLVSDGRSVREASEESGCSQSSIRRWMADGGLRPTCGRIETDKRIGDMLPPDADIPKSLMYLPDKVAKCIRSMVSAYMAEVGLKPHHLPVIMEVGCHPHMSQRELGDKLPIDKSRISMIVKELTDQGILANESDGKMWSLALTERGEGMYESCRNVSRRTFSKLFDEFDREDIDRLGEYAERIDRRIDSLYREFSEDGDRRRVRPA